MNRPGTLMLAAAFALAQPGWGWAQDNETPDETAEAAPGDPNGNQVPGYEVQVGVGTTSAVTTGSSGPNQDEDGPGTAQGQPSGGGGNGAADGAGSGEAVQPGAAAGGGQGTPAAQRRALGCAEIGDETMRSACEAAAEPEERVQAE